MIIDFGINDSISSLNKIAIDEMKQYMSEMAAMAKEKGAVPVLVSPVYNSKYQHKTYRNNTYQKDRCYQHNYIIYRKFTFNFHNI